MNDKNIYEKIIDYHRNKGLSDDEMAVNILKENISVSLLDFALENLSEEEALNYYKSLFDEKDIAKKIISSQNSIMIEYKNKIYISSYNSFDNEKDLISAIKECELPNGEFENKYDMTIYDDYNELIQDEYNQVYEDLYDIRTYR